MQEERYSMSILGANEDTKKQNKKQFRNENTIWHL
jgi:hypothetical protein